MANLQVAKDFFQHHLPVAIQSQLDFNTLKLQPGTYISKALQSSASDILYTINFLKQEGSAYLYILAEHQSSVDNLMPLRLWEYIASIWRDHLKKNKGDTFPLVIPLVFYNGTKKYDGPKDIRELIDAPQELIEHFLLKPFHLVDTHDITDEEVRERHWSGLMEFVMKNAYEKETLNCIQLLLELLKRIVHDKRGADYGTSVLNYFLNQTETSDPGRLIKVLETGLTESGDNVMGTVADYLRQEGRQEGMQQGETNLLMSMLKAKFKVLPDSDVQKIKSANLDILRRWAINFVNAKTLDEVFNE